MVQRGGERAALATLSWETLGSGQPREGGELSLGYRTGAGRTASLQGSMSTGGDVLGSSVHSKSHVSTHTSDGMTLCWDPAATHLEGYTGGGHLAPNLTGHAILGLKFF